MNPLVSIIVPIYNTGNYIHTCIDSLINQTYKNIEIILVNDGSTDSSLSIIQKYAKGDKRIKVISQENGGVTLARKKGWQNSTGKYCLFIDADDSIQLEAIEYFINILSKKEYDFIAGNYDIIYDNGKIEHIKELYPIGEISVSQYITISVNKLECIPSICIGIFKREIINEEIFNIHRDIFRGEDSSTLLGILNNVNSIFITDYVFYHYTQRNDSVTHTKDIDINYIVKLYELQYSITVYKNEFLPILLSKLLSYYYYCTDINKKHRIKSRILFLYKKEVFKKLDLKSKIKYICIYNNYLEKILSEFVIHE